MPSRTGRGGARPNPSIIGARSSCTPLHPLRTVCTTIAPRVLHFSAVHWCCSYLNTWVKEPLHRMCVDLFTRPFGIVMFVNSQDCHYPVWNDWHRSNNTSCSCFIENSNLWKHSIIYNLYHRMEMFLVLTQVVYNSKLPQELACTHVYALLLPRHLGNLPCACRAWKGPDKRN